MFNKRNIIVHLLSLCVLYIGFVLCRYVFFDIHGMRQFPVWLFVVGMIFLGISFFFEGRITPICTAFAYIAGFIAGVGFQADGADVGGGTANNFWMIWSVVFVCLTLAGIICEKFIDSTKESTK